MELLWEAKENCQKCTRSIKYSSSTRFYDFILVIIVFEIILCVPFCAVISFIIDFLNDPFDFPGEAFTS